MINKIKIGDKTYKVIPDSELLYAENALGQIRYRDIEIHIMPDQEIQLEYECLVHEAVHGMMAFMSINDKEKTVERITNGLLMLIRDNKELFENYINLEINNEI